MPSLTRLLTLVTPHPQGRQIEASQVFSSEETRFYSDLSNEAALPQSRHLNGKLGTTGDLWPAFLCVEAGTSSCPSVGRDPAQCLPVPPLWLRQLPVGAQSFALQVLDTASCRPSQLKMVLIGPPWQKQNPRLPAQGGGVTQA